MNVLRTQPQRREERPASGLVPEERIPLELRITANLAFVMADVTDTMLMDVQNELHHLDLDYSHETKLRFRQMMDAVAKARRAAQAFTRTMYAHEKADEMCDDSDFLAEVVWLVTDIVGGSHDRERMVMRSLLRMRSELHHRFAEKIRRRHLESEND